MVVSIRCCLAEIYLATTWQSCRPASSIRCLCSRFCAYLLVEAWYSTPSLFSMYLLLHTCWFVPSQGAALFWLGVVDWCMQPFLYYLCPSLNLQASVWSWNQSFMIPLPSISFQAQPRVAGCFHPSLSCRPLDENDLTELPVGIFDSLTLLNFLYVIAQKARCEIPFFLEREGKREKREGGNYPRCCCLFNRYYPLMAIFTSW